MSFSPALCPACDQELPLELLNRAEPRACPVCDRQVQVILFPSAFRPLEKYVPAAEKKEGEAGCFYHPGKPAVAVCDFCGVLLSDLSDLRIQDRHICPPCFAKPGNKAKLGQLDRSRTLYDGIALILALTPFFFTALAAVFLVLRYWKKEASVVPRSRVRYLLALIFASLQILAWIALSLILLAKLRAAL